MSEPARTALTSSHESAGARLVDFAGWWMPIQYSSIVKEHLATRAAVGLFDISHMGRIDFRGGDAVAFVERLVTRRVQTMKPGQVRYALVCNQAGTILDDVLVYRHNADADVPVQLVVNASNRPKILAWLEEQMQQGEDVRWVDQTGETCMIAVQGPRALDLVAPHLEFAPQQLKYYTATFSEIAGQMAVVSRTGYTGEDGVELTVPHSVGPELWQSLATAAADIGGSLCGLGARDTLRLEAAMPLYGHELSESVTPFDVGLDFAVQFKDHSFVGRDALLKAQEAPQYARIGLQLTGRRPAREHYPIQLDNQPIGEVTSGTFSPTLQVPIAMARVASPAPPLGSVVGIDARGSQIEANVVKLPFYQRNET